VASFYTEEFYRRARERLAPGGILSQFVPVGFLPPETFRSVVATFTRVFPRSTLWYNTAELILMGAASDSFAWDASRVEAKLRDPRIHEDLEYNHWGGAANSLNQPPVLLAGFLAGPRGLSRFSNGAPLCRDDRPTLEYTTSSVDPATTNNEVLAVNELHPYLDRSRSLRAGASPGIRCGGLPTSVSETSARSLRTSSSRSSAPSAATARARWRSSRKRCARTPTMPKPTA